MGCKPALLDRDFREKREVAELFRERLDQGVVRLFPVEEGRYQATWKREFKLQWRKAGLLISMIKWTRTSRLSMEISFSLSACSGI